MSFKGFSSFSFGDYFVQQSRTILAILVLGHNGNISVKLFGNQVTECRGDV